MQSLLTAATAPSSYTFACASDTLTVAPLSSPLPQLLAQTALVLHLQDVTAVLALVSLTVLVAALCVRRGRGRKPSMEELKEPLLFGEEDTVVPQLTVCPTTAMSREQEGRLYRTWTDDDYLLVPVPVGFARDMVNRTVFTPEYTLLDDPMKFHMLLREIPRIVSNPTALRSDGAAWVSIPSGYRADLWDALLALYTLTAPYSGSDPMSRQASYGGDLNRSVSRWGERALAQGRGVSMWVWNCVRSQFRERL